MCDQPVNLNLRDGFRRGALAAVIFEPSGRFAFKLFKSGRHPDYRDDPLPENKIRAYFRSELDAYLIVSAKPQLAEHVPVFHGVPAIASVVDANGSDVSALFLLDCCLKLERICGDDRKWALVEREFPHLQDFDRRLRAAGVDFTLDANVFNAASPEAFKVIDIATRDAGMLID
jgi:hypothetical protein